MSQLRVLLLLKGIMLLSHSLVLLSITHTETTPVELRKRYQTNSLPVTRKHQQKCIFFLADFCWHSIKNCLKKLAQVLPHSMAIIYILAIRGYRRQETLFFSLNVVLNNKTWALFLDLNWWADTFYVYAKDNRYCDISPLSSVRKQPTSRDVNTGFPAK